MRSRLALFVFGLVLAVALPVLAAEWYQKNSPPVVTSDLAATTGAALVGIADSGSRFTGTDLETALQETMVVGDVYVASCVVGAEAAVAANAIEVACTVKNALGTTIAATTEVMIRSLAVTADKGDLAAAGTPVGTAVKTVNPATGENVQWMTTTSGGLFSFRVTNDQVETTIVQVLVERGRPYLVKLTFAA